VRKKNTINIIPQTFEIFPGDNLFVNYSLISKVLMRKNLPAEKAMDETLQISCENLKKTQQ